MLFIARIIINGKLRYADELNMNILKDVLLFKDNHIINILYPEEVDTVEITNITEVRDISSNANADDNDSLFNYLFDYKRDLLVIK